MSAGRLYSKNVLITGGSQGIGRAIALAFAQEGANIVFTYKSNEAAALITLEMLKKFGVKSKFIKANLTEAMSIKALVNESVEFLGYVDILVNNAGVNLRTSFTNTTPEEFDYIFNTNLRSPFFLSQEVARHMLANNRQGSIINISSLSSERAVSRVAHYQCSKAALSMLTKSIAYELAPFGIRVNTISPGLTATEGNREHWEYAPEIWEKRTQIIPLGRAGTPEDHVGAALLLASDESSWITGTNIVIDGGQAVI